jgi:hypothetical protein
VYTKISLRDIILPAVRKKERKKECIFILFTPNKYTVQYTAGLNKKEAGFRLTLGIKGFNAALGVSRLGIWN